MAEPWTTLVRTQDPFRPYVIYPALYKSLGTVKGQRVLDLGRGEGLISRWCAAQGAHVCAIDQAERLIATFAFPCTIAP